MRERRNVLGMSQSELADRLGLTFQQVQKYETGLNRMGAGRLFEVARILQVPVIYFFDDLATEEQPQAISPITELGRTREGIDLAVAFNSISEPSQRRALVTLTRAIAARICV